MFFFFFFFLSWVNWLRGCSSIPMDVLPRLFIGPILVILFKKMCICTVHHKNLYHAKSSNINLCFSDSKTFGSSCNWSYSGLMLSWRSGIKCCNIHIQGKCCTLCSYDNVCLKCIPLFVCLFFFNFILTLFPELPFYRCSTIGAIIMTPLLTKLLAGQLVPVDAAVSCVAYYCMKGVLKNLVI